MQDLIIFGAAGHARVLADAARESGKFNLLGFIDKERAQGDMTDGLTVLGDNSVIPSLLSKNPNLVAIIGIGDNAVRRKVQKEADYLEFVSVIHPKAVVAKNVKIGEGTFIAASATINCGTTIGAHAVINTNATVDHGCRVGDFSAISPGATLAGGVHIGSEAFIGISASIIPEIKIGDKAIVGAGAVVIRTVENSTTVVGVPACPVSDKDKI